MIKKGTARFKASFIKVLKAGLICPDPLTGKIINTPSKVKCCEVCLNEAFGCHLVCKYRSATYKEYLDERYG